MPVKFAHLRIIDEEGKITSRGGCTIAYKLEDDGFIRYYVYTHCHPKDNFSKRLGRIKAEGMLKSKRMLTLRVPMREKTLLDLFYSSSVSTE